MSEALALTTHPVGNGPGELHSCELVFVLQHLLERTPRFCGGEPKGFDGFREGQQPREERLLSVVAVR